MAFQLTRASRGVQSMGALGSVLKEPFKNCAFCLQLQIKKRAGCQEACKTSDVHRQGISRDGFNFSKVWAHWNHMVEENAVCFYSRGRGFVAWARCWMGKIQHLVTLGLGNSCLVSVTSVLNVCNGCVQGFICRYTWVALLTLQSGVTVVYPSHLELSLAALPAQLSPSSTLVDLAGFWRWFRAWVKHVSVGMCSCSLMFNLLVISMELF